MRVAITGGTGFVGGHLASHLARHGHQVVLVARGRDQRPWARQVLRLPQVRLVPATPFDLGSIRAGLPAPGPFGPSDLRCRRQPAHSLR